MSFFGASAPAPATSSLFGAPAPAPGGSTLFGAPAPAPAPAGGTLFGAAPAPSAASNPFGAAATSASSGIFGAPAAPAPAANPFGGTSLFGAPAPTGTSLFGAPAPAPAHLGSTSLFGGTTPATGGLFGAPAPAPAQPAQPQGPTQVTDADIFNAFLQQMAKAWDANDYRMCSFKHVFFDDLSTEDTNGLLAPPPAQTLQEKRKASYDASDQALWARADARNPDPQRFCPVQITGFQALHERHAAQQRVAAKVDSLLQRTRRELHALADEREASFALRLRHYTTRQLQLSHRIVRLAAAIESQRVVRALPQGGAYGEPPLNPSEQAWVDELRMLASAVRQPGQGRARLHELSSELQLHATGGGAGTRLDAALAASGGTTGATRLNLAALREWLERHQANLKRLLDIQEQLQRDAKATLAAAF